MSAAHTSSVSAVSTGMSELDELMMRVERAWVDDRDRHMVERLARLHPEHADALYEFFDDLILAELMVPTDEENEAMQRAVDGALEKFFADENVSGGSDG